MHVYSMYGVVEMADSTESQSIGSLNSMVIFPSIATSEPPFTGDVEEIEGGEVSNLNWNHSSQTWPAASSALILILYKSSSQPNVSMSYGSARV